MSKSIDVIEAEVLGLSAEERSRLLETLLASLAGDPEIEEAWLREASRRDAQIESGAVKLVPGDEALARLRAGLR